MELRPPSAGLGREESIEAWIDLRHALSSLARRGTFSLLTDNAVGVAEEEGLSQVGANVAQDVDVRHIVPILTAKHSLDYCRNFAARAAAAGLDAITVTGGDQTVGPPRCVPHGSDLRTYFRKMPLGLALGGWLNPHKPLHPQAAPVLDGPSRADFALTQIVSHHSLPVVEGFLRAIDLAGVRMPVVFGVFYYRSGNPKTLAALGRYFPVPAAAIVREFDRGVGADELCARSLRALGEMGIDKVYVSNLGTRGAAAALDRIVGLV